jgi:hypothetical protein
MDTIWVIITVIVILAIGAFVMFFVKDQYNPSGMGAALGGTMIGGKIVKHILKNKRNKK